MSRSSAVYKHSICIGVMRISASAMANAMREISLDQGLDPRKMTLLPFGGAGPLMGTLLADELALNRIIIPPFAGNFSAWGLLGADMVQSAAQTLVRDFDSQVLDTVNKTLARLFLSLARRRAAQPHDAIQSARLDLRYKGQEHTLSIEIAVQHGKACESANTILERFVHEYARTFGTTMNEHAELVTVRASLSVPLPQRQMSGPSRRPDPAPIKKMEVYSFARQKRVPFNIIPRSAIHAPINGPAIITEHTSTTYVDVKWRISSGEHGELLLKREM